MARLEDHIVQNHMGSVVHVKPGLLRAVLIRAGLWGLGLAVRVIATDGYLGSMRTIHFAHWALVSNGGRLVFFSNFDGSWESYLDDFIEKAHAGLTLAWGNCVGFPGAQYLVFEGATPRPQVQGVGAALDGAEPVLVQRLRGSHRQPDRAAGAGRRRPARADAFRRGGRRMDVVPVAGQDSASSTSWRLAPALAPDVQGLVVSPFDHLPFAEALFLHLPEKAGGTWLDALRAVAPVDRRDRPPREIRRPRLHLLRIAADGVA